MDAGGLPEANAVVDSSLPDSANGPAGSGPLYVPDGSDPPLSGLEEGSGDSPGDPADTKDSGPAGEESNRGGEGGSEGSGSDAGGGSGEGRNNRAAA